MLPCVHTFTCAFLTANSITTFGQTLLSEHLLTSFPWNPFLLSMKSTVILVFAQQFISFVYKQFFPLNNNFNFSLPAEATLPWKALCSSNVSQLYKSSSYSMYSNSQQMRNQNLIFTKWTLSLLAFKVLVKIAFDEIRTLNWSQGERAW